MALSASLLGFGFYLYCIADNYLHARFGDNLGYRIIAFRFRLHGVLSDYGSIRTYLYPAFLALLSFISGFSNRFLGLCAGVTQYALLLASTEYLCRGLDRHPVLRTACRVGFLANPFILALVADSLTEGIVIPLAIGLLGIVFRLRQAGNVRSALALMLFGDAVAAVALEIRPASIAIAFAWVLAASLALCRARTRHKRWLIALNPMAALIAFAAVAYPQWHYNEEAYGVRTPFPACPLSVIQATAGASLFKFSVRLSNDGTVTPIFYSTPFPRPEESSMPVLDWYLAHPGFGVLTVAGHLLASYAPGDIFTYQGYPPVWLSLCLAAFCLFGSAFGALHAIDWGRRRLRRLRDVLDEPSAIPAAFVVLLILGTAAVNAPSAVETRFNVLPMGLLFIAAIHGVFTLVADPDIRRRQVRQLGAALAATAILMPLVVYIQYRENAPRVRFKHPPLSVTCEFTHDNAPITLDDDPFPNRMQVSSPKLGP